VPSAIRLSIGICFLQFFYDLSYIRLDNRLFRVYKRSPGCSTGCIVCTVQHSQFYYRLSYLTSLRSSRVRMTLFSAPGQDFHWYCSLTYTSYSEIFLHSLAPSCCCIWTQVFRGSSIYALLVFAVTNGLLAKQGSAVLLPTSCEKLLFISDLDG
jgi:hypothetical protein